MDWSVYHNQLALALKWILILSSVFLWIKYIVKNFIIWLTEPYDENSDGKMGFLSRMRKNKG